MSNPAGINDLNRVASQGYGEVKRQTQLTKEAPISGAPVAAQALNTPRRSQKHATRSVPQQQAPEAPPQAPAGPEPTYQAQLAAVWNQVSQVPGASDLIQQYAQEAQVG